MPGRNQQRSSRGRSAIARRAINTNNTNGMMYQGTCITQDGKKITPCREFGGMKKGGAPPSATGFMRSQPWKMSVKAKHVNYVFKINYHKRQKNPPKNEEIKKVHDDNYTENSIDCSVCYYNILTTGKNMQLGCYIKSPDNSNTNYCCLQSEWDGSGCASKVWGEGTTNSVCYDNSSNGSPVSCFIGRGIRNCSGTTDSHLD